MVWIYPYLNNKLLENFINFSHVCQLSNLKTKYVVKYVPCIIEPSN
jgi:hypothetical protein